MSMCCRSLEVSVAGCLGYDVLVNHNHITIHSPNVSVVGCLGYDVLATTSLFHFPCARFQLLVV